MEFRDLLPYLPKFAEGYFSAGVIVGFFRWLYEWGAIGDVTPQRVSAFRDTHGLPEKVSNFQITGLLKEMDWQRTVGVFVGALLDIAFWPRHIPTFFPRG